MKQKLYLLITIKLIYLKKKEILISKIRKKYFSIFSLVYHYFTQIDHFQAINFNEKNIKNIEKLEEFIQEYDKGLEEINSKKEDLRMSLKIISDQINQIKIDQGTLILKFILFQKKSWIRKMKYLRKIITIIVTIKKVQVI